MHALMTLALSGAQPRAQFTHVLSRLHVLTLFRTRQCNSTRPRLFVLGKPDRHSDESSWNVACSASPPALFPRA